MTVTVNVHEAKTQLSKLLEQALAGEEIIITRDGTPIARLTPIAKPTRTPGRLKGIRYPIDFDVPLPEDERRWWEGRAGADEARPNEPPTTS